MSKGMPESGTDWPTLKAQMLALGDEDVDWRHGRNGMNVFFAGEDVLQVAKEAYTLYMSENALNMMAFPSLKAMEQGVLDIGLTLLHAPDGAKGNMTSGGTESILLAVKAARNKARADGRVQDGGELVLARSAHPAFDKAAHYLGLKTIRVPVDETSLLADPAAMDAAVTDRTIMIVGSAPAFPSGCIDPIVALGDIAHRRDLWLHVDACVGGYFIPFAVMNGLEIAPFDFEVPSVSSMSADLHKYGYCAKGASTVFYRHEDLWAHQIFDFDQWPCGRMITPTLAGTRPGGAIAAAYAVLNYLGQAGYRKNADLVIKTRQRLEEAIEPLGLAVWGRPQLGLISFGADDVDIFAVWGKMFEKGWFPGLTTEPAGLHMMLTPAHDAVLDTFVADLAAAVDEVRGDGGPKSGPISRYT